MSRWPHGTGLLVSRGRTHHFHHRWSSGYSGSGGVGVENFEKRAFGKNKEVCSGRWHELLKSPLRTESAVPLVTVTHSTLGSGAEPTVTISKTEASLEKCIEPRGVGAVRALLPAGMILFGLYNHPLRIDQSSLTDAETRVSKCEVTCEKLPWPVAGPEFKLKFASSQN